MIILEPIEPRCGLGVDSEHRIFQLLPQEVLENWEELAQLLAPAIDASRGDLSAFGLLHSCAHEMAYCFVGLKSEQAVFAIICSLHVYHTTKVCHIDAYAGPARLFYPYLRDIEIWALANGCEYMEGHGDEGAERLAKRHGFYHSHVVYRKPLGTQGNGIQ